jgi:hypothetical protein
VEHSRNGVAVRAVKSNWFGFDSIFDSKVTESYSFNSILIQYSFNSKTIQVDINRISSHSKKKKLEIAKLAISKGLSNRRVEINEN